MRFIFVNECLRVSVCFFVVVLPWVSVRPRCVCDWRPRSSTRQGLSESQENYQPAAAGATRQYSFDFNSSLLWCYHIIRVFKLNFISSLDTHKEANDANFKTRMYVNDPQNQRFVLQAFHSITFIIIYGLWHANIYIVANLLYLFTFV